MRFTSGLHIHVYSCVHTYMCTYPHEYGHIHTCKGGCRLGKPSCLHWDLGLTHYLPVQTMEVNSSSRVRDLCEGIATRLKLASLDGCSLFIKITDKVSNLLGQGVEQDPLA